MSFYDTLQSDQENVWCNMYVNSITAVTGSAAVDIVQQNMGFTGPWAAGVTGAMTFYRQGQIVTMSFSSLLATATGSGANTNPILSITAIPATFRPAVAKSTAVVDVSPHSGTSNGIALFTIGTDGFISTVDPGGWAGGSNAGILSGSVTYSLLG